MERWLLFRHADDRVDVYPVSSLMQISVKLVPRKVLVFGFVASASNALCPEQESESQNPHGSLVDILQEISQGEGLVIDVHDIVVNGCLADRLPDEYEEPEEEIQL